MAKFVSTRVLTVLAEDAVPAVGAEAQEAAARVPNTAPSRLTWIVFAHRLVAVHTGPSKFIRKITI